MTWKCFCPSPRMLSETWDWVKRNQSYHITLYIDIISHFIKLQVLFNRHDKPDLGSLFPPWWIYPIVHDVNASTTQVAPLNCAPPQWCPFPPTWSLVYYLIVFTCSVSRPWLICLFILCRIIEALQRLRVHLFCLIKSKVCFLVAVPWVVFPGFSPTPVSSVLIMDHPALLPSACVLNLIIDFHNDSRIHPNKASWETTCIQIAIKDITLPTTQPTYLYKCHSHTVSVIHTFIICNYMYTDVHVKRITVAQNFGVQDILLMYNLWV